MIYFLYIGVPVIALGFVACVGMAVLVLIKRRHVAQVTFFIFKLLLGVGARLFQATQNQEVNRQVAQVTCFFCVAFADFSKIGVRRECWDGCAGPHQAEARRSGIVHHLLYCPKTCGEVLSRALGCWCWSSSRRSGSLLHLRPYSACVPERALRKVMDYCPVPIAWRGVGASASVATSLGHCRKRTLGSNLSGRHSGTKENKYWFQRVVQPTSGSFSERKGDSR